MICHLGVVVDGYPMVVPTAYGLAGDTLYLRGSAGVTLTSVNPGFKIAAEPQERCHQG